MRMVQQRAESDCGVAALAMISEQGYEDAYVAVTKIQPDFRGKRGLDNDELIAAGKLLGLTLESKRAGYDLDDDDGILRVRWNPAPWRSARDVSYASHYVVVTHGLLICPTYLELMPWRDYLQRNHARACTLLRCKDGQRDV